MNTILNINIYISDIYIYYFLKRKKRLIESVRNVLLIVD